MLPSQGYNKALLGQVCLFKKSLYVLKQASTQWNIEVTSFLKSLGFTQSQHDHYLFTKTILNDGFLALLIYVDLVIVSDTSISEIETVKPTLHSKFTIKDLGHLKYFLGLEVARSHQGIFLSQKKLFLISLEMQAWNTISIPSLLYLLVYIFFLILVMMFKSLINTEGSLVNCYMSIWSDLTLVMLFNI